MEHTATPVLPNAGTTTRFWTRPLFIVGGLTLFGALLRFYNLGYKSFWLDEAVIYHIANHPFAGMLVQNAELNSAPPLFVFLIHWMLSLGDSELMLRLVPWLGGVISIPAAYLLARQFFGRIPAYFTAALVMVAPRMVEFSQQLREYSFTFALACLMLYGFSQFLHQPTRRVWGGLTLLWVVAIFTQYGLVVLIGALNLVFLIEWILAPRDQKPDILKWGLTQIIGVVALIIVYGVALREQMSVEFGIGYLADGYWDGTVASLRQVAIGNTNKLIYAAFSIPNKLRYPFLALLGLGTLGAFLDQKRRLFFLLLLAPMGVVFGLALLRLYPYNGSRQVIFLLPMIMVMAGYGFSLLDAGWQRFNFRIGSVGVAVVLVLIGLWATRQVLQSDGLEHLRPIINTLSQSFRDGDRIYIYGEAQPAFSYYYREHQEAWVPSEGIRGNLTSFHPQLDELSAQPERLWMVLTHCYQDDCAHIVEYFSDKHPIHLVQEEVGARLYLAP